MLVVAARIVPGRVTFQHDGSIADLSSDSVREFVAQAFNALAAVYGVEAHTAEQLEALAR